MRPFAGELASAVSVCAVAAALTFELPSAAYSFRAGPDEQLPTENGAFAAYVFMDAPTEAFFLRKAKDTWRKGGSEYADLSVFALPEEQRQSVLTLDSRNRPPAPPVAEGALSPFLPSCRAPEPVRIPAEADKKTLPFSREELLKID